MTALPPILLGGHDDGPERAKVRADNRWNFLPETRTQQPSTPRTDSTNTEDPTDISR